MDIDGILRAPQSCWQVNRSTATMPPSRPPAPLACGRPAIPHSTGR